MGRWPYGSRGVVEETPTLTIEDLKAWGFLEMNCYKSGILTLSRRGEKTGTIGIAVDIAPSQVDSSYIKFKYNLDGKPVEYRHGIELFPCYYGGYQFYFVCRGCGRRVTALYLEEGYYACRHCLRLSYLASRRHRSLFDKVDRANHLQDKAEKLKKRGHPRKAKRVKLKADLLREKSWMDAAAWMGLLGTEGHGDLDE